MRYRKSHHYGYSYQNVKLKTGKISQCNLMYRDTRCSVYILFYSGDSRSSSTRLLITNTVFRIGVYDSGQYQELLNETKIMLPRISFNTYDNMDSNIQKNWFLHLLWLSNSAQISLFIIIFCSLFYTFCWSICTIRNIIYKTLLLKC